MEKKYKDIKEQSSMVKENEIPYRTKVDKSQDISKITHDELKDCYTLEESKALIVKAVHDHFHKS